MPNLTLTVTASQATRIAAALVEHYKGTALATATLDNQARDFFLSAARQLVRDYEERLAKQQALATVAEL